MPNGSGRTPTGEGIPSSGLDEVFIEEDVLELDLDDEPHEPTVEDRRALAKRLAEQAKAARRAAAGGGEPERTDAGRRLAERARLQPARPKTAAEVLEAQRRAEQEGRVRAQEQALVARRRAEDEARRASEEAARREAQQRARAEREAREAAEAEALAALERATFAPRPTSMGAAPQSRATRGPSPRSGGGGGVDPLVLEDQVTRLLEALVPGVQVVEVYATVPPGVVGPLWRAHAVRARHDRDLATALAADGVIEALERRTSQLAAARVSYGGVEWAVWCDAAQGRVLGALTPADLYLVGLQEGR